MNALPWLTLLLAACGGDFECDEVTPCDFGEICVAGECIVEPCATSAQCPIETHCGASRQCEPGCESDEDCKTGFACDGAPDAPGECAPSECEVTEVDCGFREFCNTTTGECYDAGDRFCKPCETATQESDCGEGNYCLYGYCGTDCSSGGECPSGFECVPVSDAGGNPLAWQCFTYCWLYEDYEPGSFALAPPPGLPVSVDVAAASAAPAKEGR